VVANAARSINAPPTAAGLALVLTALLSTIAPCVVPTPVAAQQYDVVIVNGIVVDGTGAPRFRADVAIDEGRIALIDRAGIDPTLAGRVIDAEGQVVTPGFIDNHAHVQQTIAEYPLAENFLRQGITTLVASLHSGDQPWPFEAFASSLEMSPNVGFFAGHSWTRKQVMGMENRAPTPEELEEMKALVDQSMREGALGLSTGLLYVPANFAETEEVIELAKVASAHGGIYVSHMRNEASGLLESVAEVIRIADEADIPAQINHHKAVGAGQWGWSERTLAMIDSANAAGLTVTRARARRSSSPSGLSPAGARRSRSALQTRKHARASKRTCAAFSAPTESATTSVACSSVCCTPTNRSTARRSPTTRSPTASKPISRTASTWRSAFSCRAASARSITPWRRRTSSGSCNTRWP
jgi:hypothetical protein